MRIAILKPWLWIHKAPRAILRENALLWRRAWISRRTLLAVTRVDFQKKYSGSVLGVLWYPLYSSLLLGMYSFVYMVIFKQRYADFGKFEFVLFIFSGMIPYLGFSDAISTGTTSIKSNIAIVKNTIFPVELIPVKQLLVSLAGLSISLGILLVLLAPTKFLGLHLLYLPIPMILLFLFSISVIWFVSAIAVLIPDTSYLINLMLLFFMFISPIGFSLDKVPESALPLVLANPMTYLIESFRFALLGVRSASVPLWCDAAFGFASLICACISGAFFRRLMPLFSDFE